MLRWRRSHQRLLITVLFTDIVGSTERATRLGDRGWKALLARHHAIVRRELRRFHGRELDTAGDGFFASFERPAQAIECAIAIIDALRPIGLDIRAAVHMGEAEVMGSKVGGVTVHVASRALAQAGPGQILTTSTVREVTAGADVTFEDRGVHQFKGVAGEWHLYGVHAQHREAPATRAAGASGGEPRARVEMLPIVAVGAILLAAAAAGAAVLALANQGAAGPGPSPTPLEAQPNSAVRLDQATGAVLAVIPAGGSPAGIAVADDTVWILSLSDRLLTAVPAGGGAPRPIGLPGSPTGLAAGGGAAWLTFGYGAAGEAAGFVLRIGAANQRQENRIPMANGVGAIAIGESAVWVANGLANTVSGIDPGTRTVSRTIDVGEQPNALAVADGSLWVGHLVASSVWQIAVASGDRSREIALRDAPTAVAAGLGRLWVGSDAGHSLVVVDLATGAIAKTIALGQAPRGVAVGGDAAWVAGNGGSLFRIDGSSLDTAVTMTFPGPLEGVATSDDEVWVTVQE